MPDASVVAFFQSQQEAPSNKVCCDCGFHKPEWASVSHGIYISIEASSVHRSLGVRTSFVQSLKLDVWKPLHLRMMELGGNQRFNDFLREHGVPEDWPIRAKYSTRAADWYRRNLRAMAEETTPPSPLPPGTGHLPSAAKPDPALAVLDRVYADVPSRGSKGDAGRLDVCKLEGASKVPTGPRDAYHADVIDLERKRCLTLPDWMCQHLQLAVKHLKTSSGDRADSLRRMSSGQMEGFGSDVCSH